jgi:uncharacterized membrane protein YfcA
LPLAGTEVWLPGIVLLGLAIGFLSGMFGVGGGFLLTPVLKVVFGIPYPVAVGSGLAYFFLNSGLSAFRHWRNKKVDVKLGLILAAGALCGAEIGVRILSLLDFGGTFVVLGQTLSVLDTVMNLLFIALLTSVAVMILRETASQQQEVDTVLAQKLRSVPWKPRITFPVSGITGYSLWVPLLLSFGVGILTGLMGVGGGFINFPLLIYVVGVPTHIAIGTSAFQILFASGYGALRHALLGHVELILVGLLFLGSLAGVQVGVKVSQIFGGRKLRRYFSLVVLLGVVVVLWDWIRLLISGRQGL